METSRFFVSNLHANTTEEQLKRFFANYGKVTRVELKTKKNLVDEENVQVLAFVTLQIGADDAQYCINELNWQKLNGAKVNVSLAKESFLERLKREREETNSQANQTQNAQDDGEVSELLEGSVANTRKKFDIDAELDDEDIAPELLITKKRAANSMRNGRIVIDNYAAAPIHVIEKQQTAKKQLDATALTADQKRKESLGKMKQSYEQQKTAIQKALAGENSQTAKKIKFSDAEEDEENDKTYSERKSKTKIFGSDDEEDTSVDFTRPELYGKKGERLLQMQSHQSADPRFKIDAKFVDGEEDEDERDENEEVEQPDEMAQERDWQMGILAQVVGTKAGHGTQSAQQHAAKQKTMLRYDPSKAEHQKYLRQNELQTEETAEVGKKQKKKRKISESAENVPPEAAAPVSKEVFYTVSDTLTQALKTRGDGFSLLNMFGQPSTEQQEQREQQLQAVSNQKILVNKFDKHNALNPFSHESDTDEEDEEIVEASAKQTAVQGKAQKSKTTVMVESFFIPKNDVRLKDGAKFFKYTRNADEDAEDYEVVRNRLKSLIKTKITKSRKHLNSASGKMKRNRTH